MYISSSSKLNGFYKLPKSYLFFFWPAKLLKGDITLSFQLYFFLLVVVWAMCFGGISLVLPFSVLDFFLLPPLFRISLSGYLMWIVWQRYLSRLSCLQGHSLWVHNQIFTFYYAKICRLKTASNIESHRCLCTTSVFTSTQNVGINASCCVSLFCIHVLYGLFPAFLQNIRYQIQRTEW